MNDKQTTIAQLQEQVRDFTIARDWEKFHHPKDLALHLAIEVGEVLEHFRYQSDAEIGSRLEQEVCKAELAHELADVLWILLRLADVCRIDLSDALSKKLALAEHKYPVEQVRGLPHKYTHYEQHQEGKAHNIET